ncbi:hypothetical protein [Anaerotignum sp.]|uniref:hypothetical protein n=1 Tax=Anaerotignum sp. TaxID=2039241 RepID=UPI002714F190|nr:hypothetical protein [Anaerotignum sp.]
MNTGKKLLHIFIFALIFIFTGCTAQSVTKETGKLEESVSQAELNDRNDSSEMNYEKVPSSSLNGAEDITPYQLLYFICGNMEEMSFGYTVTRSDSQWAEIHFFQRKAEASVDCFTTQNMNGNAVTVREIEKDGKVSYILDDSKQIKTYQAPAEDFLLYRMITASKTLLQRGIEEDGYMLYEYSLPFEQDETMQYKYRFYMKDNILKKLVVSLEDREDVIYEFTEFQQAITDATAFEYPKDYIEENYDGSYTGESMPPWWEVGNDN